MQKDWNIVLAELSAPFMDDQISWKPQTMRKDKTAAMATAHIDARAVMDRLDAVVGPDNWSDEYEVIKFHRIKPGKWDNATRTRSEPEPEMTSGVICKLTVMGVTKSDVGVPSDYESTKGAFSDALKRAGVKFGIARYLYDMPSNIWYPWRDSWQDGKPPGFVDPFPAQHWRMAGLDSPDPIYPPGVEAMTDVDFYEFYMEVRDFVLELEQEPGEVSMGSMVEAVLEKTTLYIDQQDVVRKLTKAKEDGDIEELGGYQIHGSTNLPTDVAITTAAFLMGARAGLA